MNLTEILEADIDPKEISQVLIEHAMQSLGPKPTEEEIRDSLIAFAESRMAAWCSPNETWEEKDAEGKAAAIGLNLYRFAEERIKQNRLLRSLSNAFAEIERHDIHVTHVYIPSKDWVAFRQYVDKNSFDEPCYREQCDRKGYVGHLWCADVFLDNNYSEITVTNPEYIDKNGEIKQ